MDQDEARGQRAREGTGRVEGVDERMDAGRIREAARERLRQDGDRSAHQDRGRREQQQAQEDVEAEGSGLGARRQPERDALHRAEQQREGERVEPDAHLREAVDAEQGRLLASQRRAVDGSPGDPAEHGVAGREAAQVQAQHRRRRLAVAPEQRRQVLLPGNLVDQAAEACEEGQKKGDGARHR